MLLSPHSFPAAQAQQAHVNRFEHHSPFPCRLQADQPVLYYSTPPSLDNSTELVPRLHSGPPCRPAIRCRHAVRTSGARRATTNVSAKSIRSRVGLPQQRLATPAKAKHQSLKNGTCQSPYTPSTECPCLIEKLTFSC